VEIEECHTPMPKQNKSRFKLRWSLSMVPWILFAASFVLSLRGLSSSLTESLLLPLRSLFGSHHALDAQVLEVSGNVETVKKATRQLLQPWGTVRLSRRVATSTTPDAPPPSTLASPPP
jgi:hypothetical protein